MPVWQTHVIGFGAVALIAACRMLWMRSLRRRLPKGVAAG